MKTVAFAVLAAVVGTAGFQPALAQPSLRIHIPLPPPIILPAPPSVVVLPETRVYVAPEIREDLFFFDGWWWRPWEGRWYRSHYYDRGWVHYGGVPFWYRGVPHSWREDYRSHRWGGGAWNHRPIHYDELQRNWRGWNSSRHWEQPQFRQHEVHRDGRPYPRHETGRRTEPIRHDAGPRERESRRPVEHSPMDRGREARGREDPGAREPGRMAPPPGRPGRESAPGRPEREAPRGRPGGSEPRPESRRERH